MPTWIQRNAGRLASLLLTLLLCAWAAVHITGAPIESDASQNLNMSLNLAHQGTIAYGRSEPYVASMYREPLPVAVTALAVDLVDAVWGRADSEAYFSGDRARWIKYQNVLWWLLLGTGIYCAVRHFTGSRRWGLVGMVFSILPLPMTPSGTAGLALDDLLTDLAAAAILVWGSLFLARTVSERQYRYAILSGLTFGAMALTKAAFIYVFYGICIALPLLMAWNWPAARNWRRAAGFTAVLAASFAVVVLPWMLRNYKNFGVTAIADRGGVILLMRAEKDLMTAAEYRGSFYVWANPRLQPLVGALLGYTPADMNRSGSLHRLNREAGSDFYEEALAAELAGKPDEAITFYHRARARRVQLEMRYGIGVKGTAEVDKALQAEAKAIILAHPWRHLAMVVPFLWRGALTVFPVLLIALVYAGMRRNYSLLAFATPAFGIVMFYSLVSHYTPRYSTPMVGVAMAAGMVIVATLAIRFARLRR